MRNPDIRIEFCAEPRLLGTVRESVRRYVASTGFSVDEADAVTLAVDEACANAIRHSYGGPCDRKVELLLRADSAALEIEVSDEGTPARADRLAQDSPQPTDPESVEPGGRGLALMRQVFDEVEFRAGPERGNRVVLRLNRRVPPPDPRAER